MEKFTEFDLEMAFNAGRMIEGGKPDKDDSSAFDEWFENYIKDDECK